MRAMYPFGAHPALLTMRLIAFGVVAFVIIFGVVGYLTWG